MNFDCLETRRQFARAVAATLCGIYGKPSPEKETLRMWFHALQELSIEEVEYGLQRHMQCPDAGQFPPKPADILRHARGTPDRRATLAWGRVLEAMQRVGAYESVDFDDPAIHCAVRDMGGWVVMCQCDRDDWPFVQRRFEAAYKAYFSSGCGQYPTECLGIHAQTRAMACLPMPEPKLLGLQRTQPAALPAPARQVIDAVALIARELAV